MTTQEGYWGSEHWYTQAYYDAYLMFLKPQIIQEIADEIFKENRILKHMREQGDRRARDREAFKNRVKGKGWR